MKIKPIIITIVGDTGVGKTTLVNNLYQKHGIPTIVSFTTRPKRKDETNGIEHWFVDTIPSHERLLAYTNFGGYDYWTTFSQTKELGSLFTYVIDEKGLIDLENQFNKEFCIVKIKIERENKKNVDVERLFRDNERIILNNDFYDVIFKNDKTIEILTDNVVNWLQKEFCL